MSSPQDKTMRIFRRYVNGVVSVCSYRLTSWPHLLLCPQIFQTMLLKGLGALALLFCIVAPVFAQNSNVISEIRVIGNRRIPKETVLARLFSHVGDPYDPLTVERDFNSLWNTGYFEDVRIEREDTPKGVVLDIYRP